MYLRALATPGAILYMVSYERYRPQISERTQGPDFFVLNRVTPLSTPLPIFEHMFIATLITVT
jgi:hypothetical protein